jgi:deoxyribose-phosphate aldolase
MSNSVTLQSLAKMIDHSLLHPTMTDKDIVKGCGVAKKYNVATACIKPYCIPMVRDLLAGSEVKICPVIAFPHGNSMTAIKVKEAEAAVLAGGQEIDMVVNIGKVLSADWKYVSEEIKAINDAVTAKQAILKVIFENDYLPDDQIIRLCEICSEHQVAFVKTSSGYGFVKQANGMYNYQGATDHHLRLMRKHTSSSVQIKAAGAIRTLDDLLRVRELGVTRIGATAIETILEEAKQRMAHAQ